MANPYDMRRGLPGGLVRSRSVSFVLPAYNEAGNIVRAVESVVAAAAEHCGAYEVIVVDDGSVDSTAALVQSLSERQPEVRLVRHDRNRGYGSALSTGFAAARCDYVFLTDADNQFDMSELPLLLEWSDRADVVAGFRRDRQDPVGRRVSASVWNLAVRALFSVPLRDVDCAFKLFRRDALAALDIESHGAMVSTEVVVKLARSGATFVEIGVTHRPRTAGSPKGARPGVVARALSELLRLYPQLRRLEPGRAPAGCTRAAAPGAILALPDMGDSVVVELPQIGVDLPHVAAELPRMEAEV